MSDAKARGTDWLEVVRAKVARIRFGTVQIVVHDGRVTAVESTEKTRITDLQRGRTEKDDEVRHDAGPA